MNLSRVNRGDLIKVDIRGRVFEAVVVSKKHNEVRFVPIYKNITHFHAKANQVKRVVRRAKVVKPMEGKQ